MTEFVRRHSVLFTSLLLVACSAQLMNMSIQNRRIPQIGAQMMNGVLSPLEKLDHEIFATGEYYWNRYLWLMSVESEREELTLRVKALEAQNARLLELESENQRLRSLIDFKTATGLDGVAATVIGRDPSNWTRTVTVDRGSNDGITPGMAVVDGHAVVGQVTAVNERSSRILLLTDNSSAIDTIVQGSRSPGIAEGTVGDKLQLRFVLREYEIKPGDRVVTSGLDGVYPKGTLVGVVTGVNPARGGLFQAVEVAPSVDVNRLESVLVVTSREPRPSIEANDKGTPAAPKQSAVPGNVLKPAQ